MQTGYEPLNTLKPVGEGLWLIDGPAEAKRLVPLPTRATVAQLPCGGLWVHNPTPLTEPLMAELAALGPVRHLVSPNTDHETHFAQWHAAYPEAELYSFHDALKASAWADIFETKVPAGTRSHHEAVFFHKPSKTLILTDLIHNLETGKLPVWARPLVWFAGVDDPNGRMPPHLRRAYKDKDALADSIQQIIAWRPRRILLAHGRWYPDSAVAELERAFRKELSERLWMDAIDKAKAREAEH